MSEINAISGQIIVMEVQTGDMIGNKSKKARKEDIGFALSFLKCLACMLLFASVSDIPIFKKTIYKYGWK